MSWKSLGAICLALAVAVPAAAQRGQTSGSMPGQLLKLQKTLELTEDQVTRLESIQQQFAEQAKVRRAQTQELREQMRSGDLSRNELRELAKSNREAAMQGSAEHQEMIDQVITDLQRDKLAEMREAGRQGVAGQSRGRGQQGSRQGFRRGQGGRGQSSFRRGSGQPGMKPGSRRGGPRRPARGPARGRRGRSGVGLRIGGTIG